MQTTAYLSTAYLAPVQYYCKLLQYDTVFLEMRENFQKQTYRNRCIIASANGALTLSVPVIKPETLKCPTQDIRISDHGNWRHLHWNALVSAYRMSPFFDYYADDFAPFYERKYTFLIDYNEALYNLVCQLIDLQPRMIPTSDYRPDAECDFRSSISPKNDMADPGFRPIPYYQVFQDKHGFLPNMSIVDLLFNMGPESLLVLRDSIVW